MKYFISFALMLVLCGYSQAAGTQFTLVKLSKSTGNLQSQIQQQQLESDRLHQKMFVQITADWCSHCRKLNDSLGSKKMRDALQGSYIVQLDEDEWADQLQSIGVHVDGIPAFFRIDKTGSATDYTINGGAWGEDTVANMAPPLKNYFSHAK